LNKRKTTDIDSVVRTVLGENPRLKAEFLVKGIKDKTGKSRSTIYDRLDSLVQQERIFREKGFYSFEDPTEEARKFAEIHAREIASGLRAFRRGKYLLTGTPIPDVSRREQSLQHLRTGSPVIYKLATEDEDEFIAETERLASDLEHRWTRLKGLCTDCARRHGKTIDEKVEREVRELLGRIRV